MEIKKNAIVCKSGKNICDLFNINPIDISDDKIDLNSPQIFIHSIFDLYKNNFQLTTFLNEDQWRNLRTFKDSILIHENYSETFDIFYLIGQLVDVVNNHKINPKQIYILLADELHVEAITIELHLKNIYGINIDFYNRWALEIPLFDTKLIAQNKKFSAFSRRFVIHRLHLFFELVKEGVIDQFNYSFNNIDPYKHTVISLEDLQNEIILDNEPYRELLTEWISGIPYRASNDTDYTDIYSDSVTIPLLSSDIHLNIETHLEPFQQHPIAWITEKTYRAIVCKKPFLTSSIVNALTYLKKLGFKTFSPYIDESYDSIIDGTQRRSAIVKEIKRISQLNNDDYRTLLSNCNHITEYNFQLLLEKRKKTLSNTFKNLGVFK
jgi:hypothetical protein